MYPLMKMEVALLMEKELFLVNGDKPFTNYFSCKR